MERSSNNNGKLYSYLGLIFVIFVWGISPLVSLYFYNYFSPTIRVFMGAITGSIALFFISFKKLKLLNKQYFILACSTGFFLAAANILQKIGLKYSTPTHYAFLENLSVIVVPVILFVLTKKKPNFLTIFAAILCLVSSFVLTGMFGQKTELFSGDILCALAGILYGVNIAVTGTYAKKVYVPLYLMLQTFTEAIISLISAIVFDQTGIEKIFFTFDIKLIVMNTLFVILASTLCWIIRTNAMKKIAPNVVAVMMPFSSTVTMLFSVITGKDTLTRSLIIGAVLGLIAVIISGLSDKE